MKKIKFYSVVSSLIFITSCDLIKKTSSSDDLAVINLDTIESVATTPEPLVYQGSVSRTNDIIHTKLDVKFDWTKQYLNGNATITIKPYFYPTSSLELDARGMEIKDVSLVVTKDLVEQPKLTNKGKVSEPIITSVKTTTPLKYVYENDIIKIQLDKEYKNSEQYTVFIEYIAKPNELKKGGSAAITDDKGLYFINADGKDKNKPQQIWTQGETQSSSAWYPTIDKPNERMTQEIYITVENKFVTLSNGELASSFDNGDGTRTDYWKLDLPHAPYLTMMAIGDFAVIKDNKWRGKEVNYYIEKEFEPYAKAIFGNTPEMLEFYSTKLGVEYAWNKYSQIIVRDYVSGAMENTSATLHGEFLNRTDREMLDNDNEDVIAHELFHQWFGDLVTCESWSNLPLNESFATYGEYLWEEYKYGRDAADLHSAESRAGYIAESGRKKVPLIRYQYDDKEDMFDGHSYNKGGQVLHMLRKYVGDDAFFASLKLYLETNKFTSVEIHQLRLAFEQTTGEDLNWFFNQWFLASGHPDLVITNSYNATTKKQKVQIIQVQDFSKTPLFRIPMYIDLYVDGKVEHKKVVITKADEVFEFDVTNKPSLVNVDAEKMLLCTKYEKKPIEEWAFQYKNAPLFLDRYEAIEELAKSNDSIAVISMVSALNDKFWYLRAEAISYLKKMNFTDKFSLKDKMSNLAAKDEKAYVRVEAINYLADNYNDEKLNAIYKNALNDKSYAVLGAALSAIAKNNPKEGMIYAKQYENEKNNDVLFAIADLYAKNGSDENNQFFINSADKFTAFSKIGFVSIYGSYLKNVKRDETVNSGVKLLSDIASNEGTNKWVVYYIKKSIKDLATMYEDREAKSSQKIKDLKAANPNVAGTQELELEIENAKNQKQRILDIYNTLK
jgi:aminopeptidase N